MGYMANCMLTLTYSEQDIDDIETKLNTAAKGTIGTGEGFDYYNDNSNTVIEHYELRKYNSKDVMAFLENLKTIGHIEENSEYAFVGEDDSHWRFVYKEGKWVEQSGEIVYTDIQIKNQ